MVSGGPINIVLLFFVMQRGLRQMTRAGLIEGVYGAVFFNWRLLQLPVRSALT